jgi:hypothetical protein
MNPNWQLSVKTPYLQNSLEFTQPGAKFPGAWDKMLAAPPGPFAKAMSKAMFLPGMYRPEATDEEQRGILHLLATAQRIATTDELAKLGDLPIIAAVTANGSVLIDQEAFDAGAWFLVGDEKKQYTVPAYLMKTGR